MRTFTKSEAVDVLYALTTREWQDEDVLQRRLAAFEILWAAAHDDRVEFEDVPGAMKKHRVCAFVRDLRAQRLRLQVEAETVLLVYDDATFDLRKTRIRRRAGSNAWKP